MKGQSPIVLIIGAIILILLIGGFFGFRTSGLPGAITDTAPLSNQFSKIADTDSNGRVISPVIQCSSVTVCINEINSHNPPSGFLDTTEIICDQICLVRRI